MLYSLNLIEVTGHRFVRAVEYGPPADGDGTDGDGNSELMIGVAQSRYPKNVTHAGWVSNDRSWLCSSAPRRGRGLWPRGTASRAGRLGMRDGKIGLCVRYSPGPGRNSVPAVRRSCLHIADTITGTTITRPYHHCHSGSSPCIHLHRRTEGELPRV